MNIDLFLGSGAILSIDQKTVFVGYGHCNRSKEPHELNPSFYFPDFFLLDEEPWLQFEYYAEMQLDDLITLLQKIESSSSYRWNIPSKHDFEDVFKGIHNLIEDKKIVKAVPYLFSTCDSSMTKGQLQKSLVNLLEYARNFPIYVYGFWNKFEGILGGTPELLFKMDEQRILTMALAGTCEKNIEPQQFLNCVKDRKEHQITIDGIKDSLKGYGEINVGETTVLELPKLFHMITKIEVNFIGSISCNEIINRLHPTPALGAYPKEAGRAWLEAYQNKIDRGRFGAPAALSLPRKKMSIVVVCIRNVQWCEKGMRVGAGCGIIKESEFENEWDEINLKINATTQKIF